MTETGREIGLEPRDVVDLAENVEIAAGDVDVQRDSTREHRAVVGQPLDDAKRVKRLVRRALARVAVAQVGDVAKIGQARRAQPPPSQDAASIPWAPASVYQR